MKMNSLALLTALAFVSSVQPENEASRSSKIAAIDAMIVELAKQAKPGLFLNTGVWDGGKETIIQQESVRNTGMIKGDETVVVESEELDGDGVIAAPKILLRIAAFKYTGIIKCSGTCTIETEGTVDTESFKFEGGGKLEILKMAAKKEATEMAAKAADIKASELEQTVADNIVF
ncbi:MAG TPA: hypothetical protein QGF02_00915 [Candidatus Babeliales bacterium]|nr:hypothetical protein [Candidatus Babeliales bacterium]